MKIATNKTPHFIIVIAVVVFGFMVFAVTDANYQMMLRITQEKFIGQSNPFSLKEGSFKNTEVRRLYNTFSNSEKAKAMAKALGYSLATLLIIAYYKNYFIKIFFVCLDSSIIFVYLNKSYIDWWSMGSYIYAAYTGLILFFIGLMASTIISEYMHNREAEIKNTEISDIETKLEKVMAFQNESASAFHSIIERQNKIVELNNAINRRKAVLRRQKKDWKGDNEVINLMEEKNNL